jgi:hypothetical protein
MASACWPDATGVIILALNLPFEDAQLEVSRTVTPSVIVRNAVRTTFFAKIPEEPLVSNLLLFE